MRTDEHIGLMDWKYDAPAHVPDAPVRQRTVSNLCCAGAPTNSDTARHPCTGEWKLEWMNGEGFASPWLLREPVTLPARSRTNPAQGPDMLRCRAFPVRGRMVADREGPASRWSTTRL